MKRSIKIKVSEVMGKLLNNYVKENKNYCIDNIVIQKFSKEGYAWYVGDIYDNEVDYDYITDKYKAIRVIYKAENYACDKYITTKELNNIYVGLSEKTLNNFLKNVIESCAI